MLRVLHTEGIAGMRAERQEIMARLGKAFGRSPV